MAELSNQAAYGMALPLEYNCGFGQAACNVTYSVYRSDPFWQMARNPVYYFNVSEQTGSDQLTQHRFTWHRDYADSLGYSYGVLHRLVGPTGDLSMARSLPRSVSQFSRGTLISETLWTYALLERSRARSYFWEAFLNVNG